MKNQLLNLTLIITVLITSFSCNENEDIAIENDIKSSENLILLNNKKLIKTPLEGDEIINFQIEDTLFQFNNLDDLRDWNEVAIVKLGLDENVDLAKQVNDINNLYEYAVKNDLLDSEKVPEEALKILGLPNSNSSKVMPAYVALYDGSYRTGTKWEKYLGVGLKPSLGSARNKVNSFYAFGAATGWMCDRRWGGGTKWYWIIYPEQYQNTLSTQANRWESWIGVF